MAIDNKTRALVYYLSKIQGLSIRQITKKCNVPRATVWRINNLQIILNPTSTAVYQKSWDQFAVKNAIIQIFVDTI